MITAHIGAGANRNKTVPDIRKANPIPVVFVLGDFNSNSVPIPGVRWMGDHGIDKIGVVQSRAITVVKKGQTVIRNPSDHDALSLNVSLKKN